MDRQKLLKYLDDPATLNGSSLADLQELVRQFPYFSAAQILLAKNFHNLESVHYNKQLKLASAYSSDRKLLYSVIMENQVEPVSVITEVKETISESVEKEHIQEVPNETENVPVQAESVTHQKEEAAKEIVLEKDEILSELTESQETKTSEPEEETKIEKEEDKFEASPLSPREIIANRLREITGGRVDQRESGNIDQARDKSKPDPDLSIPETPSMGTLRTAIPVEQTSESIEPEISSEKTEPEQHLEIIKEDIPVQKEIVSTEEPELESIQEPEPENIEVSTENNLEEEIIVEDEVELPEEIDLREDNIVVGEESSIPEEKVSEVEDDLELEQTILEELPVVIPESRIIQEDENVQSTGEDHSNETHSFSEWLKLTRKHPESIDQKPEKQDKQEITIEDKNSVTSISDENLPPLQPASKEERIKIIDKFIQEEPRIEQGKNSFFSPLNMARQSVKQHEDLYSETLAKIYDKQGNYLRALHMYEKLRLKYPEKSTSFAAQITRLKSLIDSQEK